MSKCNALAWLAAGVLVALLPTGAPAQTRPAISARPPAAEQRPQAAAHTRLGALAMEHGKLQAGHDLLDLLQTAHDSITGAIHTLHCRFDSRTDNEHGHFEDRGEYWRSLDSIRLRDRGSFPGGRTGTVVNMDDYAIIAGRLFIYNMQVQGEQKVAGGSINPPTGTGPDVWRLALLSFADPHHAQVTLDELLRKAHKSRRVRRVERWGHAVLCLEVVTDENALIEVWF